ncbi:IPT/TIG domain-containing protein [Corallococcus interemptor]|uniref:trypco2 family protein n=1 Tax=Corallococcus TaxID=83461 RepID=UPI001CBEC058|nr:MULTISPECIES: trypco2 family protein [unclassified Corallococcus]MBZ4329919.1 IPT/TIG domain-containing protein [Corallococcus sp. AS-1-12]MBZ4371431.1 IPT/TIG domain-containing protein [Corallococcus sp. AS-1-6]
MKVPTISQSLEAPTGDGGTWRMVAEDNQEWQLAEMIDAIAAEVDRAEDTLALKSYARRVSFAVKALKLDLSVTVRRSGDGGVWFRTMMPGESGGTLLNLDFSQILESQLSELRAPLESSTAQPLHTLPGIREREIQALAAVSIFSLGDLERYTRAAPLMAEVGRKTGIPEHKLRRWRKLPALLSISPPGGASGDTVVVRGTHLGRQPPPGATVLFQERPAEILDWGETHMTVRIPPDVSGPGTLYAVLEGEPTNLLSWEAHTQARRGTAHEGSAREHVPHGRKSPRSGRRPLRSPRKPRHR